MFSAFGPPPCIIACAALLFPNNPCLVLRPLIICCPFPACCSRIPPAPGPRPNPCGMTYLGGWFGFVSYPTPGCPADARANTAAAAARPPRAVVGGVAERGGGRGGVCSRGEDVYAASEWAAACHG